MYNNKRSLFIIALLILSVILLAIYLSTPQPPTAIDYGTLVNKVQKGEVRGILFDDSYNVYILYKDSEISVEDFEKGRGADAIAIVTNRNDFAKTVEDIYRDNPELGDMPIMSLNDPNAGSFWNNVLPIMSFVLIAALAVFMFFSLRSNKNGGGNAMNFGKTRARLAANVKVKFTDVAGAEEEKAELSEIVDFLKSPKKFSSVGARIPKGVLLVGPPGTGKTLFAKAVAGEAGVPFFSLSGSDFVEMFVGVGASRVRDLFAQAKKNMPCIVFIDEIDAVGRKRGAGLGGGNDEREQTLNQLLVQMDGFEANDGIIIMAATNRADVLDPALLRPGRFDRQVFVNVPDVRGREAIFRVHSRNKPISPEIEFKLLARMTTGFSGADIENLLNEAAILAARNNRVLIIMSDLLESINKVIAGPQKRSRVVTETDKRITAYHEAGHAIVSKMMKYCNAVQEVSIIPRGFAAGYTLSRPKNDDNHVTKNKLNDEIASLLGGRAAEEIVIEDISTGASSDIKHATGLARSMVSEWGMSEALPNVFYGGEQEVFIGRDFQTQTSYSDEVAAIIDAETKKIITTNYQRAYNAVKDNLDIVHNMVKLLFERETIYSDEVDMLIEGKSVEEVLAFIDEKNKKIVEEAKRASQRAAALIVPEPTKPQTSEGTVPAQEFVPETTPEPAEIISPTNASSDVKEDNNEENKAD